jgi:glycosyltransferase involved in cell wall biosynthesis
MKSMNIVLLAEVSAIAVIGGAERVLREQALGLQKRGHRVNAVVRTPPGDPRSQVALERGVEHRYTVSRRNSLLFVLSSLSRSVRAFDRVVDSGRADAALIHQAMAGFGPILRRRARAAGWVYVCHSLAHEEYLSRAPMESGAAGRLRRLLNSRLRLWVERIVLRGCERVVVLSEFMKRRVQAAHGVPTDRLRVIPGGADPARFHPPADPTDIRRRLGLPLDKVVLLAVRNLVPRMGLHNLVQAIAKLGEEANDLLLLLGGEGEQRASLQQLIEDLRLSRQVRMVGFISEELLPAYYQAADLVLMPTHELEGFGLVTVEALACGTPVLGTPVGALPEVLSRVDPRLIAEGTDGASLSHAIRLLLRRFRDHPGEEERVSRLGRDLIVKDYNWDRHNEQLETVVSEAIRQDVG